MGHLVDVEFLAADGSTLAAGDDVVEFGGRWVPRWAVLVALVLAAIVVASSGADRSRPNHPPAHDASTAHVETLGRYGAALRLDGGRPGVLDVLIHRDLLYVLRPSEIMVVDVPTRRVLGSVRLSGGYSVEFQASARLLLDADADRLWVVVTGAEPAQLLEFDASRLRPVRRVTVHFAVQDATAMRGHLYLATSAGVADLAPDAASPTVLPGAHGAVSAIAADPARDRILAVDASSPGAVVVVSVGRVNTRRIFGNLIEGSIAVVGDEIWVGGSGDRGGLIARLDPATLAPVQTSGVALKVDRVVLSSGARDIWVGTGGPGLWCVDAANGDILEHWAVGGAPTSRAGAAYFVDFGAVVPLVLAGCTG